MLVRQLIERLGVASHRRYECCGAASGTGNRVIFSMFTGTSCRTSIGWARMTPEASAGERPDTARGRSASFCGALVTTSKTSSGTDCCGTRRRPYSRTFAMLPRERRKVATLDWDSSILGRRRKGRTLRTTIRELARCTGPWRRPATCCIWGSLRDQGSAAGNDQEALSRCGCAPTAATTPSAGEDMRAAGGGVLSSPSSTGT